MSTPININLGSYSSPAGSFTLNLINPITTSAGKTYYYLDADGNGGSALVNGATQDGVSHDVLDYLFNFGSNTTASARTVFFTTEPNKLQYGFRLPTVAEYSELRNFSPNDPPVGWGPGNPQATYWTADLSGGYHSLYALNDGQVYGGATWPDTIGQYAAFEVFSLPPTVSFTTSAASSNEGNSGSQTVTVNVSLSSTANTAITIPITVSGTATVGADYTGTPTSITIPANVGADTTASARTVNYLGYQFKLPTVAEYSDLRNFSPNDPPVGWALGNPQATYWAADFSGGYHSLYALNDGQVYSGAIWPDGTSQQSVAFEVVGLSSTPTVINLGTYSSPAGGFTLNLINPITTSAGKTYYYLDANGNGGSALVNGVPQDALSHDVLDYFFSSTTGNASFTVVGDTTVESNETVVLTMGTPTGATLGTNTTYTHTITNDDVALPTISFTSTTTSANEGINGNQTITVNASLSGVAASTVTVPITVSGTATANTDYTNAPTSITIPMGSTSGSTNFNVVGDTTLESNETVVLTMGAPSGGAVLGTNSTFVHIIKNDDLAPPVSGTSASLYLSDSFETLETYFVSDAIADANSLITDKLEVAWQILNASTAPLSVTVNGTGTAVTYEYAANSLAAWKGGARVTVNGSSLSTDANDTTFSITSADFVLTSSEDPSNWANPLAKANLGLGLSVTAERATAFSLSGITVEAGDMKASFTGPLDFAGLITSGGAEGIIAAPNVHFEISYDSDPSAAVVLSRIYFDGALSLDLSTEQLSGSFNGFGLINGDIDNGGHYFYGTNLNVTTAELESLPEDATQMQLLQAVFEGANDTVYSKTDIFLPDGFENLVIQGAANVAIDGNAQNNQITGNSGNNTVDGSEGWDTFVTQGTFAQSSGILKKDGSVTLTAAGSGTDTLSNMEQVQFSDGAKILAQTIDSAELTYTVDPSQAFSFQLSELKTGDGIVNFQATSGVSAYEEKGIVLASGKYLVARTVRDGQTNNYSIELTKTDSTGQLDASFGTAGKVKITGFAGYLSLAETVTGQILVSQSAPYNYGFNTGLESYIPRLWKLDSSGTVVASTRNEFASTAWKTPLNPATDGVISGTRDFNQIDKIIPLADGDIIAVGHGPGQTQGVQIRRLNSDLSIDSNYGYGGGLQFQHTSGQNNHYVQDAGVDRNGNLYVLSNGNGDSGVYLTKITATGSIDASWGGIKLLGATTTARPLGLDISEDGSVFVAYYTSAYTGSGTTATIEVAKFRPNGTYDTSFGGGDGKALIEMSGDSSNTREGAQLLSIDSEGRPVIAFQRFWGTEVVRLKPDGTIDTIFTKPSNDLGLPDNGDDPILNIAAGSYDQPMWVQVDASDNILVGVTDYFGTGQSYAVAKFLETGGLDFGFDEAPPPTHTLTTFDGSALPSWINFNPATLTISGTAPSSAFGDTFLKLTATSASGPTAEIFSVNVNAGEPPKMVLTTSVDPTSGKITVSSGFTGVAEAIGYDVFVQGAQLVASSIVTQSPTGWSVETNPISNTLVVRGYGEDPALGDGSLVLADFVGTAGARDAVIALKNNSVDPLDGPEQAIAAPTTITVPLMADVTIKSQSVEVFEGSAAGSPQKVSITFELERALPTNQTLAWQVLTATSGDSVDGADFAGEVLPTGVVQIAAGQRQATVEFSVAGDQTVERNEGFRVALTPSAGLDTSQIAAIAGVINNDDYAKAFFDASSLLVPEGNTGVSNLNVKVKLDQAAIGTQKVNWALETLVGEASAADFSGPTSGVLTFAEGQTEQTITLGVQGDTLKEGREDFKIKLTADAASTLLVDPINGALLATIKDDDGYNLDGNVYFWGGGNPAKQYLMDDVDVGLFEFTTDETPESVSPLPLKMQNIKLNTDTGIASSDLWVEHTDVSSFSFRMDSIAGSSFTAATLSGWNITTAEEGAQTIITGMYTGTAATADRIKIGSYRFESPDLDSSTPEMRLLSGFAANDANQQNTIAAPVGVKVSFEQTTDVVSPLGPEDGGYGMEGLVDGIYNVYADRDFTPYSTTAEGAVVRSSELAAVTASDARAAYLISLGRGSTDARALIAADYDGSGMVTAGDARNILLMSLGKSTQLQKMDWKFIDESADLSGVTRSTVLEGTHWKQGAGFLLEDDATHNLIGILLGDVNGSWTPGTLEEKLIHTSS